MKILEMVDKSQKKIVGKPTKKNHMAAARCPKLSNLFLN